MYVRYNEDGTIYAVGDWAFPESVEVADDALVQVNGVWYDADKAPQQNPEEVLAKQQAAIRRQFTDAIQKRLDDFAKTKGYDGIMSAASYATSTDPTFRAEGERAVALRDQTWRKCYDILAEVLAGERPVPTLEEIVAELPALTWE